MDLSDVLLFEILHANPRLPKSTRLERALSGEVGGKAQHVQARTAGASHWMCAG
jgi:hypothetical protein